MEHQEIIAIVNEGMAILEAEDEWLLRNDLSERSIAHRLAYHLQHFFDDYCVDCEYNGAMRGEWYERKKVQMLKQELLAAELELRQREKNFLDDQLIERSAYPDIIIHKRGNNDDNLCIIEIKKSTSDVGAEYDELKLRSYTQCKRDDALCYQLGIFILIQTGGDDRGFSFRFFQNGREFTPESSNDEHN
jgi:hypothetical protein